ncbi:MAG: hypothetical protein WC919_02460 [Candidatus Paceibacterota bacterium]|jgi:sulfur relay (sulfurtransferase) DsrF/TusC family protein|nr:hypothetical protein [Candidatus Paceibacterota bacterium]
MEEIKKKEYIIIYKSLEHFEVLGFVEAASMEEARALAQNNLLEEAKKYKVAEAEIAELNNLDKIYFDVF